MGYLQFRKLLRRAPLLATHDTQDGTLICLNGKIRSVVGRLKRTEGGLLKLSFIGADQAQRFASFDGYEIDDTTKAIRELLKVLSAHWQVTG